MLEQCNMYVCSSMLVVEIVATAAAAAATVGIVMQHPIT